MKLSGGWIGHSQDHSRDNKMKEIGKLYSVLCMGFTTEWWAPKHNRHHLSCNETENDTDI